MRSALLAAAAVLLLTLSACVIEPYGDGRGDHYYHGERDDGHRVWRE